MIQAKLKEIADLEGALRERIATRIAEDFPDSELLDFLRNNDPCRRLQW